MRNWISQETARYLGLGLQLAVTLLLGLFLGYFIDRKLDSLPWMTLAGVFFGFIIGFYQLWVQFKDKNNDPLKK